MTPLAQTALDFSRECLGWEKADTFQIGRKQQVVRNLSAVGAGDIFNASDLNAVLAAVQGWCEPRSLDCTLRYVSVSKLFVCQIMADDGAGAGYAPLCEVHLKGADHALLAACAEASRKLKGAACTR